MNVAQVQKAIEEATREKVRELAKEAAERAAKEFHDTTLKTMLGIAQDAEIIVTKEHLNLGGVEFTTKIILPNASND